MDDNTEAKTILARLIGSIEELSDQKQGIQEQIKEVYAEAKASGFDTKIIRKVIAVRRKSKTEVDQEQALLDMYLAALGG